MSRSPLTLEERYLIHTSFVGGLGFAEIANQLRRHRSVIYDEYHRGRVELQTGNDDLGLLNVHDGGCLGGNKISAD